MVMEDFIDCFLFPSAFERRMGSEKDIQDDSTAPEITFLSEIPFYYLWRNIAHSPNKLWYLDLWPCNFVGSSKIKQFYFYLLLFRAIFYLIIKHHILQLYISMNYPKCM